MEKVITHFIRSLEDRNNIFGETGKNDSHSLGLKLKVLYGLAKIHSY